MKEILVLGSQTNINTNNINIPQAQQNNNSTTLSTSKEGKGYPPDGQDSGGFVLRVSSLVLGGSNPTNVYQ